MSAARTLPWENPDGTGSRNRYVVGAVRRDSSFDLVRRGPPAADQVNRRSAFPRGLFIGGDWDFDADDHGLRASQACGRDVLVSAQFRTGAITHLADDVPRPDHIGRGRN